MSDPRTLTILLTDLVDSTKLVAALGDERALEVMGRHDRLARRILAANRGREIDKSDGFLMIFERAADGVRFALDYHRALRDLSAELGLPLAARAGLHTGAVRVLQNSPEDVARGAKAWEVEGIAKPTAARIMGMALGGQTLISPETWAAVSADLAGAPGLRALHHGHYRLKGISDLTEVYEIGEEGVAPLRPPPDAPKAHRVVETPYGWRPAQEVANNLPPERVTFFGRDGEQRAIADSFEGGARLVTLCGAGGTGKTHLACRYALAWLGEWPGGAWFCDLSDVRTALGVAQALGRVLAVPLEQGDPIDVIGEALAGRGSTLILLDNFEQLLGTVPQTVERWLNEAPQARWLVTSRQRLGVRGEKLLPIEPLPLPPREGGAAAVASSPAVQLFLDRARAVQPSFTADEGTLGDIGRLVHLLDGLPLALELAAARVRVLSPRKILERMGRRFDMLKGGASAAPQRQSTLRGAIDWSWALLEPWAKAALAQCAVFEGGFDLEAAEAVLDLSPWPDAPWPMDVVQSLVDQSLLRSSSADDPRFSLFRSIHDYAAEKLDDGQTLPHGARREVEDRHAAHFARYGEDDAREALHGPAGTEARRKLALDLDNVVVAARRSSQRGEGDLAARSALGALGWLESSGPFALAIELGEAALAAGPSPRLGVRLQVALGVVRNRAGQPAHDALASALEQAKMLGDRRLEASALAALGAAAVLQGALDDARARFAAALDLQRACGDTRGEAASLAELAHVEGIRGGQFAPARARVEQALSLYQALGDQAGEATARSYLGALCAIQGDLGPGRAAYERARDLAREVGDRRTEGLAEGMIAALCDLSGDPEGAREHFELALQIQGSIGDRVHEAMHAANYADLLSRLGEVDAACAQVERAIVLARKNGDPRIEGLSLGTLGALRARAGALAEGRDRLREGEALLRGAGDPPELAKLLCKAGLVEQALGEPAGAAARLAEARQIAARLGMGEGSELAEAIGDLARALGGAA